MALACKGGYSTTCQCPGCLTPKEELSSMDPSLPERHGVRTMDLRESLTQAIGDATKARQMFPAAKSDREALKLAKADFDRYSFRAGVEPAFHAFPGIYGAYVMLGAAYDQLHNTWIGKFKRLCLLSLCVYGQRYGYNNAVNLLNARIIASGKHDGLERCVQHAPTGLAAAIPRAQASCPHQVLAERHVQGRAERQGTGAHTHVARERARADGRMHALCHSMHPRHLPRLRCVCGHASGVRSCRRSHHRLDRRAAPAHKRVRAARTLRNLFACRNPAPSVAGTMPH